MSAGDAMTIANRDVELSEVSDQKPHPGRRMTEEEFVAWCEDKTRAEWVDGEVIVMAPDHTEHNDLNGWLGTVLRIFVEDHDLGQVFISTVHVRLVTQRRRRMPDLIFIAKANLGQIQRTYVEGGPDLALEIVSPDSQSRDW